MLELDQFICQLQEDVFWYMDSKLIQSSRYIVLKIKPIKILMEFEQNWEFLWINLLDVLNSHTHSPQLLYIPFGILTKWVVVSVVAQPSVFLTRAEMIQSPASKSTDPWTLQIIIKYRLT